MSQLGTKAGPKAVWASLVGGELICLRHFAWSFRPRKEEGSLQGPR